MAFPAPSDVVRHTLLALGRGDEATFFDGLCDDVEWHGGGVLLPVGTWRGRDAVRDGLRESAARRGSVRRVVLREVAEEGRAVLLLGTIELGDEHRATTTPNSWVIEVTGDRVKRVDAYASDSAARAAWAGRS
jgi:ketosteroid isomerase-like protein